MNKIIKSYTFEEIKQKAISFCVYQDRSHYLVEKKLQELNAIPEVTDEIISFLIKEKFLDEERFVRSYVRGKFYQKKWGKKKIESGISIHGIVKKLLIKAINEEIDLQDYEKAIESLIVKKKKEGKNNNEIYKYLLQRGYTFDEFSSLL